MKKARPIKKIQQEILRTLMILVSIMTILIAIISIIVNVKSESKRIDPESGKYSSGNCTFSNCAGGTFF